MAKKPDNERELITKQITTEFPNIRGNQARKIVQIVSQQVRVRSGPYPVPEDYDYYHEIDPELTTQIKTMVLAEQKHQHELDKIYLKKDYGLRRFGQVCALLICAIALLGGFYTVLQGFEVGGTVIGSLGLAGIVAQFLKKR